MKYVRQIRERQILHDLTCRILKKSQTHRKREEIRLVVTRGRGEVKGELEKGRPKVQTCSYKINRY